MSENKSKFCTECGEVIEDSKAFCTSCGAAHADSKAEVVKTAPQEAVTSEPKSVSDSKNKKLFLIAGGAFVAVALIAVLIVTAFGSSISGTTWYAVEEVDDSWGITTLSFGRNTVTSTNSNGQEATFEFVEETFNFYGEDMDLIHIQTPNGSAAFTVGYSTDSPTLVSWRSEILPQGLFHLYFSSREDAQALVDEFVEAAEQERLRLEEEERQREEAERQRAEEERLREEEEERQRIEEELALLTTVEELLQGNFVVDILGSPQGDGIWQTRTANDSTLVISANQLTYTRAETKWSTDNPLARTVRENNDPSDQVNIVPLFDSDGTFEFSLSHVIPPDGGFGSRSYRGMINFDGGEEFRFYLTPNWHGSILSLQIGNTFWTRVQPLQPRD